MTDPTQTIPVAAPPVPEAWAAALVILNAEDGDLRRLEVTDDGWGVWVHNRPRPGVRRRRTRP